MYLYVSTCIIMSCVVCVQACSAFYLMMKTNNELFKNQGFVRCHVQVRPAVLPLGTYIYVYIYMYNVDAHTRVLHAYTCVCIIILCKVNVYVKCM